jgi:hypothetical protein
MKQAQIMKALRPFALGVLLAAAFFVYTSHRFGPPASWVSPDPLQISEAQARRRGAEQRRRL